VWRRFCPNSSGLATFPPGPFSGPSQSCRSKTARPAQPSRLGHCEERSFKRVDTSTEFLLIERCNRHPAYSLPTCLQPSRQRRVRRTTMSPFLRDPTRHAKDARPTRLRAHAKGRSAVIASEREVPASVYTRFEIARYWCYRGMRGSFVFKDFEPNYKMLFSVLRDLKRKRPSSLAATSSDSPDACLPASNGSTGGNTGAESNIGEGLSFENTGTFIQPHYIGEATLSGFLHQFITTDKIPSPPRQQNYYKIERLPRLTSADCELPKRNDAQLLVEAVLKFM